MNEITKNKRWRSPSYPSVNLPTAIEKARGLFEKEGHNLTPLEVVSKHWGYKPGGGGTHQLVAALSYYGLVEVDGMKDQRKIKITDDTFKVIMDNREYSSERDQILKELVLKPQLYNDIYHKWQNGYPSDESLRHYLVVERKFNPKNVNDFMRDLKESFSFAKVYDTDIILPENESETEGESDNGERDVNTLPENGENKFHEDKPPKPIEKPYTPPPNPLSQYQLDMNEREIAYYPVGQSASIKLVARGEITKQSIIKLRRLLEINEDDFPDDTSQSNKTQEQ